MEDHNKLSICPHFIVVCAQFDIKNIYCIGSNKMSINEYSPTIYHMNL